MRSPVTGLVVAAGDHWQGGWRRRGGFFYEGGGLSRRAGNGAIVFEPSTGTYYYLAHLEDSSIVVATGDLVRAGQQVGRVGHSGNASHTSAISVESRCGEGARFLIELPVETSPATCDEPDTLVSSSSPETS